jgi:hypothetical protein
MLQRRADVGATVSCLGLLKQRLNRPGILKAASAVCPTAGFWQIVFTSITLFYHLENSEIKYAFHVLHTSVFQIKD